MATASQAELRYLRTIPQEIWHRLNWLVLGSIGAVALFFVPVVGWFFGLGLAGMTFIAIFGRRERVLIGPCPSCGTEFYVSEKLPGVDCPACVKRIVLRDGQFICLDT